MRSLVRISALTTLVFVVGSSSGCDNPAACAKDEARIPVRIGSSSDLQRHLNYWRLGYDCVQDGDIFDELNRRIGSWYMCTRCW